MEIINNIQWFIKCQPKTAINKITYNNINKTEFDTVIFDDSIKENIKLSFPLNDKYLFFVKREIERPVTVKKLLTFIYKFYQELLNHKYMDKAFEELHDWKECIIYQYDNNKSLIKNIDVFTDTFEVDFCGLEFNEETSEYTVHLGPE